MLHTEFHGFKSRINALGYHTLVPGITYFVESMGLFKEAIHVKKSESMLHQRGHLGRKVLGR